MSRDGWEKGWKDGTRNFDFQDAWDCACDIYLEYNGHEYRICLEEDEKAFDPETGEVLRRYESKEDFYSSTLFGRPIKEVIDDSYITWI